MNNIQAAHVTDGYKLGHIEQYVKKTEKVTANMTPRSDRLANVIREFFDGKVVYWGINYAAKKMNERWESTFFSRPKDVVIAEYKRRVKNYLGPDHGDVQIEAMAKLHDLGYLPLEIKSLPEGSRVNMQVPVFTVTNTHPDFYWLTNYVETFLSFTIWPMCNAASLSDQYYQTSKRWAEKTGAPDFWTKIANHCFAARGHRGEEDAMISGAAHLLFSIGSDTLFAIDFWEYYYNANSDKEPIAVSVNAFEHATATQRIAYFGSEALAVKDAIKNIYPSGILSYVSDSDDYYRFIAQDLVELKEDILNRKPDSLGLCKFVVRPDSSPKTPLEVICGDIEAEVGSPEHKGSLQILWDIFGGTINDKGFKVLNPKIGLIYGESITLSLQNKIYETMYNNGWCVSNILFGVGSWAFLEDSSRDSYGFAIKGTHSVVDGRSVSMSKNPKTSQGFKKSAKGLLQVFKNEQQEYCLKDQCSWEQEAQGELKVVFKDGVLHNFQTLSEIRQRVIG